MDKATPAPIMTTDTDKLIQAAEAAGFRVVRFNDAAAYACDDEGKDITPQLAAFASAHIASLCGDVEPFVFEEYPYNSEAMGCGLEDRDITDRYEAMAYGWDRAMERAAEAIPDDLYPAHTVAALKSRADALAARVAELEKDARRLDAVERNRFELTPLEGGGWDVSQ